MQSLQASQIENNFISYNPSNSGILQPGNGTYNDAKIHGRLSLRKGTYETPSIRFINCEFDNSVIFDDPEYSGPITFENCVFKSFVQFWDSNFKSDINFKDCTFDKSFKVFDTTFKELTLSGNFNHLGIFGGKSSLISINGRQHSKKFCNIEKLTINFKRLEGVIRISEANIKDIRFTDAIHKDTELQLKNIDFVKLEFDDLSNNGRMRLFDLNVMELGGKTTFFTITDSNLGKAELININLKNIHTTIISSSYLIDCIFVNVIWPEKINIFSQNADTSSLLNYREMYRQLKYSYSKQGDSVLEHRFHSLEMNEQAKYLQRLNTVEKDVPFQERWNIWQTLLVLHLSKWTSDYGQSLSRPLLTMLMIGLPLFTLTIALGGIEGYYFCWCNSMKQIIGTFPSFLSFLNPLRKYEATDVHWGLVSDFIMRIISSYCIFNFIRATRRFVK